jgi:hypothetical protein
VHPNQQVALPILSQNRKAPFPEPEDGVRLSTWRNLEALLAVRGGYVVLAAERRLRERERKVVDQVVALTLETFIFIDV